VPLILFLGLGLGHNFSGAPEKYPHDFAADVPVMVHNSIFIIIAEINYVWLFLIAEPDRSWETDQVI
jgi:hypothetical protein